MGDSEAPRPPNYEFFRLISTATRLGELVCDPGRLCAHFMFWLVGPPRPYESVGLLLGSTRSRASALVAYRPRLSEAAPDQGRP